MTNSEKSASEKSAFPTIISQGCVGLTKREYFAGLAMQGLLAQGWRESLYEDHISDIAEYSIKIADKLIQQLEK
jgi:hypothetical protein